MLSKKEAKLHKEALDLVHSDKALTQSEKFFILENYQESQEGLNKLAGAFFTPIDLALDLSTEIPRDASIIDLCAGIGGLSLMASIHSNPEDITCVELNPNYVEVGKRILPNANWICGSIFDIPLDRTFDVAISNPPFGNISSNHYKNDFNYKGSRFEYLAIEFASKIASYGAFIIPQGSTWFKMSGVQEYEEIENSHYNTFTKATGIIFEPTAIDTNIYVDDWKGSVKPKCEIVLASFNSKTAMPSTRHLEQCSLELF